MAYPSLLASKWVHNYDRTAYQGDNISLTGWLATTIILVTQIGTNDVDTDASQYKLQWRNKTDGGSFADVASTGEVKYTTVNALADGNAVTSGEACIAAPGGMTWQNGLESEGDNVSPDSGTLNLASDCYTELHWALSFADAHLGDEYEFQLYSTTGSTVIGVVTPTVTTLGNGQVVETEFLQVEAEYSTGTQRASQIYVQVEYSDPPQGQRLSQIYVQVEYEPVTGTIYDDGVSPDGLVFGGENDESKTIVRTDPVPSGGLVFGGENTESTCKTREDPVPSGGLVFGGTQANIREMEDPIWYGGLVFGGEVEEEWSNPWSVAVKPGTYRINGVIYELTTTMSYPGIGDIAALVSMTAPPTTTGYFRYDVIEAGVDKAIHVVEGTEGLIPEMPDVDADHVKLNHVLRYQGQTYISQTDIGRIFTTPYASELDISADYDTQPWADATNTLTILIYDQYGRQYKSSVVILPSFLLGNGTITPSSRSTNTGQTTFLYTRDLLPTDSSPMIRFDANSGAYNVFPIVLLDEFGAPMYGTS